MGEEGQLAVTRPPGSSVSALVPEHSSDIESTSCNIQMLIFRGQPWGCLICIILAGPGALDNQTRLWVGLGLGQEKNAELQTLRRNHHQNSEYPANGQPAHPSVCHCILYFVIYS